MIKTLIVIAIVALAISTIGAGTPAPPQPLVMGIKDVSSGTMTTSVPDAGSGDFLIIDGVRDYKAPDGVVDSTEFVRIDFPQYSRFH